MKISLLPDDFEPLNKQEYNNLAKNNRPELVEKLNTGVVSTIPLIHTTTQDRAMKILESWNISSYSELERIRSKSVSNNIHNNTDELDKILWFDKYAFLSYWKWNISDTLNDMVYLCFDPVSVWKIPWTIIAEKEIAELWAIVSQEWAKDHMLYEWLTEQEIQMWNIDAINKFYESIINWKTFEKTFLWFLDKHDLSIIDLIVWSSFPWEKEITTDFVWHTILKNYWQSFQFMIPNSLPLKWNLTSIMVWEDVKNFKKIKSSVKSLKNVRVVKQTDMIDTFSYVDQMWIWATNNVYLRNLLLFLAHNNLIKESKMKKFFG